MSTTCASIRSLKCSPPPSCPQPITTTWCTLKPTSAPTPCVGKLDVQVKITTDQYPSETTWTLTNECGLPISTSGGPFTTANAVQPAVTNCLEAGQYKFTINDAFGDGICCGYGSGSYAVVVDGVTTLTGGQFLYVESKTFGTCTQATQAPVGVSILFFFVHADLCMYPFPHTNFHPSFTSTAVDYTEANIQQSNSCAHQISHQFAYPIRPTNFPRVCRRRHQSQRRLPRWLPRMLPR